MDAAELRRLAEAATPGPWVARRGPEGCCDVVTNDQVWAHVACVGGDEADAAFVAAVNPATALGLLDRLEKAEATLARLRELAPNAVELTSSNDGWGVRVDFYLSDEFRAILNDAS